MQDNEDRRSSAFTALCVVLAIIAECVGAYFAFGAGYFVVKYLREPQEVARSQLATGAAMAIGCAFGAFLVSALLLQPAKPVLPRKWYMALLAPSLFVGAVFLLGCVMVLLDTVGLISI